jgi:hypothetical protein
MGVFLYLYTFCLQEPAEVEHELWGKGMYIHESSPVADRSLSASSGHRSLQTEEWMVEFDLGRDG